MSHLACSTTVQPHCPGGNISPFACTPLRSLSVSCIQESFLNILKGNMPVRPEGMTLSTLISPGPASSSYRGCHPQLSLLPRYLQGTRPLNKGQPSQYTHWIHPLTLPLDRNSQGQPACPPCGSSSPCVVKCHDLHCARGCHIRRLGSSDLSPSNTAALWFLSDKCGSLGLTKMNVLVYGSWLSAGLREPLGLDLKRGVLGVGSPTLPCSHGLRWGQVGPSYAPCQG